MAPMESMNKSPFLVIKSFRPILLQPPIVGRNARKKPSDNSNKSLCEVPPLRSMSKNSTKKVTSRKQSQRSTNRTKSQKKTTMEISNRSTIQICLKGVKTRSCRRLKWLKLPLALGPVSQTFLITSATMTTSIMYWKTIYSTNCHRRSSMISRIQVLSKKILTRTQSLHHDISIMLSQNSIRTRSTTIHHKSVSLKTLSNQKASKKSLTFNSRCKQTILTSRSAIHCSNQETRAKLSAIQQLPRNQSPIRLPKKPSHVCAAKITNLKVK